MAARYGARVLRSARGSGLIGIAVLTLLAGCASDPLAENRRANQCIARLLPVLEARQDADSLAAAAVLAFASTPEQRLELISRATAIAPERPALAWLHVSLCQRVPACDAEPLEARLRALDPGNGVSWLDPVSRATAASDPAALETALAALGRSERVDLYWARLVHDLTLAAERTRQWPTPEALVTVIGGLAAQAIPAFYATSRACQDAALDGPARVATCRGVARAFMHSDSLIVEMVGFGVGKRVWSVESSEGQAMRASETVVRYRMTAAGKLDPFLLWNAKGAAQFLDDLDRYPNEEQMVRARLARAGRPAEPPATHDRPTR